MVERMVPLDQLKRPDDDIKSAQIEKCKARSENRGKWCDACKNVQISQ